MIHPGAIFFMSIPMAMAAASSSRASNAILAGNVRDPQRQTLFLSRTRTGRRRNSPMPSAWGGAAAVYDSTLDPFKGNCMARPGMILCCSIRHGRGPLLRSASGRS